MGGFAPRSALSTADRHRLRICLDSVRFPRKARFLGGPAPEEAERVLREVFGFSQRQIDRLRPAKEDK